MHHENDDKPNDKNALYSYVEVDSLLQSFETCVILEKWEDLE